MSTSARPDTSELLAAYDAQLQTMCPTRCRKEQPSSATGHSCASSASSVWETAASSLPRPRGTRRRRPRRVDRAAGARVHRAGRALRVEAARTRPAAGSPAPTSCGGLPPGRRGDGRDRARRRGREPSGAPRGSVVTGGDRSKRPRPDRRVRASRVGGRRQPELDRRHARGRADGQPERHQHRRRRGRRRDRLRRLGALRERNGLRDALGRRHAAGLARARDLPGHRRASRGPGRAARFSLPRSRCVQRQPPDPRAARFHRGDDDDAVRLVAATTRARATRPGPPTRRRRPWSSRG